MVAQTGDDRITGAARAGWPLVSSVAVERMIWTGASKKSGAIASRQALSTPPCFSVNKHSHRGAACRRKPHGSAICCESVGLLPILRPAPAAQRPPPTEGGRRVLAEKPAPLSSGSSGRIWCRRGAAPQSHRVSRVIIIIISGGPDIAARAAGGEQEACAIAAGSEGRFRVLRP